jgi:hypothetical protein
MTEISQAEKRFTLDRVLASTTLARSTQLREFLQFVGRGIIEGREDQIKEYAIGVEALGRGKQFDPTTDPIVRVQAARLRQKLEEYYTREGSEDEVLITLPKGHYVPRFSKKLPSKNVIRETTDLSPRPTKPKGTLSASITEQTESSSPVPSDSSRSAPKKNLSPRLMILQPIPERKSRLTIGVAVGLLISALLIVIWLLQRVKDERVIQTNRLVGAESPIKDGLGQLFSSFLESNAPTILSFHVPPVITYESRHPIPDLNNLANKSRASSPGADWLANGSLQQRNSLTGTGELIGTFLLTQVFMQHGQKLEVKPATLLRRDDFRHANVIMLGGPRQNEIFREIQSKLNFNYPYERPGRVVNSQPLSGEQAIYDNSLNDEGTGVDYAVISKLVDPVSGYQMLLFGGNSGISVEAGVRYLTNPLNAEQILNRLKEKATTIPRAYQLVLKVSSKNAIPQSIDYVSHRVIGE